MNNRSLKIHQLPLLQNGRRRWEAYRDVDLDETDFITIGEQFARETGRLSKGRVGQATARLMPQRPLVDFAARWMAQNRRPSE